MIRSVLISVFVVLWIATSCITSEKKENQEERREPLGYRIEKDEVVFVFDIREYEKACKTNGGKVDFEDIEIYKVAVAGEFNDWSKDGWKMYQVDEHIYQLRKKLKYFDGKFEWQYKFVVNENYWAEPPRKTPNRTFIDNNLILNTSVPSLNGNTTFRLKGYKDAHKVVLAGSFNDWNESQLLFGREGDDWICRINLNEGVYQYKFIVDGEWISDPDNPLKQDDSFGNINSVLLLGGKEVTFRLNGFENARKVILAGSFNNWNEHLFSCRKEGDEWIFRRKLPPGKHTYKFIVDGKWMTDPDNPLWEDDGYGNINSVLNLK